MKKARQLPIVELEVALIGLQGRLAAEGVPFEIDLLEAQRTTPQFCCCTHAVNRGSAQASRCRV